MHLVKLKQFDAKDKNDYVITPAQPPSSSQGAGITGSASDLPLREGPSPKEGQGLSHENSERLGYRKTPVSKQRGLSTYSQRRLFVADVHPALSHGAPPLLAVCPASSPPLHGAMTSGSCPTPHGAVPPPLHGAPPHPVRRRGAVSTRGAWWGRCLGQLGPRPAARRL
ncbi:hypothetical protein J1605_003172 [Eschrichtius robustus]|uniref:Uncharacterized protein n=1 Tax=Eschrichtius robustus TaxID=9764 RepID=A0AB34HUB3_ESCRO|nr:hypothetical protein J1605_003172 [Eschrichtius robustus]